VRKREEEKKRERERESKRESEIERGEAREREKAREGERKRCWHIFEAQTRLANMKRDLQICKEDEPHRWNISLI